MDHNIRFTIDPPIFFSDLPETTKVLNGWTKIKTDVCLALNFPPAANCLFFHSQYYLIAFISFS